MKNWLVDNFLPMWAKQTVLYDNRLLAAENLRLQHKIKRLESYIQGMQAGARAAGKRRERV